jgi:hypothetical protein
MIRFLAAALLCALFTMPAEARPRHRAAPHFAPECFTIMPCEGAVRPSGGCLHQRHRERAGAIVSSMGAGVGPGAGRRGSVVAPRRRPCRDRQSRRGRSGLRLESLASRPRLAGGCYRHRAISFRVPAS